MAVGLDDNDSKYLNITLFLGDTHYTNISVLATSQYM
jgi:hypothetical protein